MLSQAYKAHQLIEIQAQFVTFYFREKILKISLNLTCIIDFVSKLLKDLNIFMYEIRELYLSLIYLVRKYF